MDLELIKKMKIDLVLIAAVSKNGVIGKNGQLPWRIHEDLTRFKELTLGHPVIMGRKTYESLPHRIRPLPDRYNIVMTNDPNFKDEGIYIAHSLEEAINQAEKKSKIGEHPPLVYVIGGQTIYTITMPLATQLEITHIDVMVDNGDAFFPRIDPYKWTSETIDYGERIIKDYSFVRYTRKDTKKKGNTKINKK